MKETEAVVKEEVDEWAEFDKEMEQGGNFLKLEVDKQYKIVISKAELRDSDKYKDKSGKPKKVMEMAVEKLNGEPCGKKWTTGSWSVMKEVRRAMKDGTLARSVFLVKKKQDGDKKSYVFEKLGELPAPKGAAPSSKRDEVGAFL